MQIYIQNATALTKIVNVPVPGSANQNQTQELSYKFDKSHLTLNEIYKFQVS